MLIHKIKNMKNKSLLLFLFCLSFYSTVKAQKKPNIIVIMADDIGISNLSCYGGDIMGVPTPNIDK
jgi:hypothetical protein